MSSQLSSGPKFKQKLNSCKGNQLYFPALKLGWAPYCHNGFCQPRGQSLYDAKQTSLSAEKETMFAVIQCAVKYIETCLTTPTEISFTKAPSFLYSSWNTLSTPCAQDQFTGSCIVASMETEEFCDRSGKCQEKTPGDTYVIPLDPGASLIWCDALPNLSITLIVDIFFRNLSIAHFFGEGISLLQDAT